MAAIIFSSCGLYLFSSFFLAYSQRSQIRCFTYLIMHMMWSCVNLECRSEMCCTRLAQDTERNNCARNHHLRTVAQLCRAISSQL